MKMPVWDAPDTSSSTECQPPTWKKEAEVYSVVLGALLKSISDYLNKITDPMSVSLLEIKTTMKAFLAQVHSNDEEIVNHKSLDRVEGAVRTLKTDISQVTEQTAKAFDLFGKEFQRLKDQLANIGKLSGSISEIAERVHVLSINASIESARAGIHGRGFKVIANEIQKLAQETQTFVKDIGGTVQNSREIFTSIDQEISKNQGVVETMMEKEKTTFNVLDESINSQHHQFTDLYSGILKFIESFEREMTSIFPLAMLHAIIIQEIGNFQNVTTDFLALTSELLGTEEGACREFDPVESIGRIRSRLTTARELDALEQSAKDLGLEGKVDMKREQDDYEMF